MMKKRYFTGFVICWVLVSIASFSVAHPHVFVDCYVTAIFDEQGLTGFQQRWVLDEMFTAFLFEDFDADNDQQFNAAEMQALKQGAFDPLHEYGYFTHILIDGAAFPVQEVTAFSVDLNDEGNAAYHFFAPCVVKAGSAPKEVRISIFDDTYYTDVVLRKNAVERQQPETFNIEYKVQDLPELTYYYDQVIPRGLFIKLTDDTAPTQTSLPAAEQERSADVSRDSESAHVLQPLLTTLFSWQKTLRHHLTRFGKDIRERPYGSSFWLFLFFSGVYGIVHALGPGHGKSIVISYFLSHPGKYLHGVLMGNLLTCVHVFSAVVLIVTLRVILGIVGGISFDTVSKHLATASYSLLIVLGFFLLVKSVYDLKHGPFKQINEKSAEPFKLKPLLLTAFVTGCVPCPGAALILMFSITQDILIAGLGAMVCMAAGMGATTSLFALFAIASRSTVFRLTAGRRKLFLLSHIILSLSGGLMILSIGFLLLLGQR